MKSKKLGFLLHKNERALSTVLTSLIIIVLVIVSVAIIWTSVNKLIKEKTTESSSCFEVLGKLKINDEYTCYDSTGNKLQFSVDVGDVKIESVRVSITDLEKTKTLQIPSVPSSVTGIKMYGVYGGNLVSAPSRNSGLTYIVDLTELGMLNPRSIKITSTTGEKSCETADELNRIDSCDILASQQPAGCEIGSRRCSDPNTLQQCIEPGVWGNPTTCLNGCLNNECVS